MTFSEETVKKAFNKAGGKCETCKKQLIWSKRGNQWHAHHKTSKNNGGTDYLSNCKILCILCHKRTYTFGG